ncbi:MAG: hypothetical protein DMD86_00115, partial [Candidatus Rokuibacteriota bacterium]
MVAFGPTSSFFVGARGHPLGEIRGGRHGAGHHQDPQHRLRRPRRRRQDIPRRSHPVRGRRHDPHRPGR